MFTTAATGVVMPSALQSSGCNVTSAAGNRRQIGCEQGMREGEYCQLSFFSCCAAKYWYRVPGAR